MRGAGLDAGDGGQYVTGNEGGGYMNTAGLSLLLGEGRRLEKGGIGGGINRSQKTPGIARPIRF